MLPARILIVALYGLVSAAGARAQWTTASLSEPRFGIAAAAVDGVALFAGGTVSTQGSLVVSDVVDIYDAATSVWSQSSLSEARTGIAATTAGGSAFFAGGRLASGSSSAVIDVYDGATGTWSVAQLSFSRTNIQAVTVGQFALFVGGISDNGAGQFATNVIDIFDSVTGVWSVAFLPFTQSTGVVTSVGEEAVILRGTGSELVFFDPAIPGISSSVSTPFSVGSSTSPPSLAGSPGRIWAIGGGTGAVGFNALGYVLDVQQGIWSSFAISEGRDGSAASTTQTKLIAGGGRTDIFSLGLSSAVDIIDLSTGSLSIGQLSQARSVPASVEVLGQVIFAGGIRVSGVSLAATDRVDIYDDNVGATYCSPAVANSTGTPAEIRLEGAPGTLASGSLTLLATGLPAGSNGYFLTSLSQAQVPNAGGSQGTLCLGGTIGRYVQTPFFTDAAGLGIQSVDTSALPTPLGPVGALSGQTWFFQAWYRDSNPGPVTNFTPGVSWLVR